MTLLTLAHAPRPPLCPWASPGKNTGVDCYAFLQGIFLTQESNLNLLFLLRWQMGSLPLAHTGLEERAQAEQTSGKYLIWNVVISKQLFHTSYYQRVKVRSLPTLHGITET